MGFGRGNPCTALFGALTGAVIFISCFLLGFSFDTLDPQDMALMYNQNTMLLECDRLYGAERNSESRRWFTGLGRGFYDYRFPMRAQTIHFGAGGDAPILSTKTKEGATIVAEFSVQYQLPRSSAALCNIVNTYGMDVKPVLMNVFRGVVPAAISQFEVDDLWMSRTAVGLSVKAALRAALESRGLVYVSSQLLSLDIPSQLQSEIEQTTVQIQGITQAQLNLQRQTVAAVTAQQEAQVTSTITVINARATAAATLLDARSRATALNVSSFAEAQAYAYYSTNFTMTSQEVLKVALIDTVLNTGASQVLISASTPATA